MKLFIVVTLVLAFSVSAFAGGYAGVSFGQVTYQHAADQDSANEDNEDLPSSFDVDSETVETGTGYKLYLGYTFGEMFGLELGYASLGSQTGTIESEGRVSGTNYEIDAEYSYQWSGITVAPILRFPLGMMVPFVKAGIASMSVTTKIEYDGDMDIDDVEETSSGSGTVMGGGVDFMMGALGVRVEAELYSAAGTDDYDYKLMMLSAGVNYNF